jgi:putative addiction module killer protein
MEPSKQIELEYYTDRFGRNYFDRWLETLSSDVALRVVFEVGKLQLGLGATKSLGGGLQELKIRMGKIALRVYFTYYEGRLIVVLAGSDKSDQDRTILKARALLEEIRESKKKSKTNGKHDAH